MRPRWQTLLTAALLAVTGCQAPLAPCEPVDLRCDPWTAREEHGQADSPALSDGGGLRLVSHEQNSPETVPSPETDGQGHPLTLEALQEIAFANNPTLGAAAARIRVARGRQIQAGLYPNPMVGYHATQIGNGGSSGAQGGFISQRLITGGKLGLDQAIAGGEIDEAQFQLQAQELRVVSDVRARFVEAWVAQQRAELTENLVEIGGSLVQATETLLEARQATMNDLLQAEIRAENARILRDNAVNETTEAWRRLAAVVGVPDLPASPLEGDGYDNLPELDWQACYESVLAGHPELNAARARVQRAGAAIARARREPVPNVDVLVSVRHNDLTASDVANVMVGLPLPVFDKNQGNIISAQSDWVVATKEVERISLAIQDRFAATFRQYANARQQARRYRDTILPKAEQSLELVRRGYEQGQVEYLTLLTAQQTFVEVNLSYLDAVRQLHVASVSIEGRLLTGSLEMSQMGGANLMGGRPRPGALMP